MFPLHPTLATALWNPLGNQIMRLLNTTECKLEEIEGEIPLYAILSHTWGKNEITLQDIDGGDVDHKAGYEKVRKTCSVAAAHGFDYVWIDTCCIDRTSSAELSEAINSMYHWYQESGVCYAYLADVPSNTVNRQTRAIGPKFSESKWFTRGWTLQELIAPSMVVFLDQEWQEMGTKSSLQETIAEITGIPAKILLGDDLERASVAQRMSWASKRKTTRVEDLAYCLMGIFGVNMAMIYGEGEKAFLRLQEEIMKISDDYSLFAWESVDSRGGLLATSPAAFSNSSKIIPLDSSGTLSGAITVDNKGIHLHLRFMDIGRTSFQDITLAIIPCTVEGGKGEKVAIYVRAISETRRYCMRAMSKRVELLNLKDSGNLKYHEESICIRRECLTRRSQSALPKAAVYGHREVVKLLLEKGADLEAKDPKSGRTPLSWAASNGHEAVVKLLLEKGAELESKDPGSGRTPLSWAASNGREAVVKLLLEEGADPDSKDPLSWAAGKGHEAVVKLFLEKGADLESKGSRSGRTPLSWAAGDGHEAVVKLLLEEGADPESRGPRSGRTPLSWAAGDGHEAVVKLLLEKRADPESKDPGSGRTPLSWAASNGYETVVKLLLENGANPESKDPKSGRTPLSWAALNGHEAVVKLLLEKGANSESNGSMSGQTPLSWAAENGHEAVVKLLLEKDAGIESKDSIYGRTPLSWAASNGHEAVVKLLLKRGADSESRGPRSGQTPLSWAASNGHEAVVKLFLEEGVGLESKGTRSSPALLSRAAENGHEAIVKLLLEKGADPGSKDPGSGRTPLSWAASNGHAAVVKLLLEKGAEPESKDPRSGRAPLSWAISNGHEAVVIMLLEKAAQKSYQVK
jgi:ankyrin repeat protein